MADDWSKFPAAGSAKADDWEAYPTANAPVVAPPKPEDPIRQKARKELQDKGLLNRSALSNMTDMGAKGYTLGFNDEITAAALTPIEMIRQGTWNPAEAYRYAKAREDILQEEAKKATGLAGVGAEIVGGAGLGVQLARMGLSLMKPGQGTLARIGAGTAEGGIYGATSGLGDSKSLSEAPAEMLKGAAIGGGAGGALTAAAPIVNALGRNAMGWASATVNPEGFAQRQLARALAESGMTPSRVAQEVAAGNAAGQPYTIADALGNPGQRMLSSVARAPGEGRTAVVNFLESRQADQGSRVSTMIDQALGAGPTARQTSKELMQQAAKTSEPLYEAALSKEFVWNPRIQQFLDDPITQSGLARGIKIQRLEALAKGEKFDPKDLGVIDFNAAGEPVLGKVPNMRTLNVIKKGIDDMLEQYRDPFSGKLNLDEMGRAIEMVRKSFLSELDKMNPAFKDARAAWAGPASVNEAISRGQYAATRGRAADNLDVFGGLGQPQQQGFRMGYADKLSGTIEGQGTGVNAARRLTTPKAQTELEALSLYNGPYRPGEKSTLATQIQRENRMFETRAAATGGSKTADNLADMDATGVDPVGILSNALSGNYATALRNLAGRSSGTLSGYTPQVREQLARLLLAGDGATIEPMLRQIAGNDELRRRVLASYLSGALAGTGQGQASARR